MPKSTPKVLSPPGSIPVNVAIKELEQKQRVCSRLKAEVESASLALDQARRNRHDCTGRLERNTAARAVKAREGYYSSGRTPASSIRADYEARMRYSFPSDQLTASGVWLTIGSGATMITDLQNPRPKSPAQWF